MKYMTHQEIRNTWLSFFEEKGHKIEPSASLIPVDDDSLLWINAGVTPLKKYFDGRQTPEVPRITNIQKCIRTNDIENVGVTKRHQTFFEMMGNFSIGDYFKKEAIAYAYELLTSKKYFAIPKEKLYITIYTHDDESFELWKKAGMSEDHLIRLDENFWEIGEGPSGPDSEIFYDRGIEFDKDGDAFEKFKNDLEQERYIEIWNNVFSQYNAKSGVPREKYKELPHKNIDTGAGLERWCLIFQNVDSNFDTDLLRPIIDKIEEISDTLYDGSMPFKVIADHIKALTFALSDGAHFENVGRGYVLRRLLRRSVRFGKKLGLNEPFMYRLVDTVVDIMHEAYPELEEKQAIVKTLILDEENLFYSTLAAGERRLYELMEEAKSKKISGKDAFKLYDTYGFPFELTLEYLEEAGYSVSKEEFDKCMEEQKKLAKKNRKQMSSMGLQQEALLSLKKDSTFVYDVYSLKSNVISLIANDKQVKELAKEGYVVLKKTCFYATSGGQIHDTGMLIGKHFKARVVDVFKGPNGQHIHKVKVLDGKIKLKDDCEEVLDKERRISIEANHSSAHLLQYALREVLDYDVKQAGSDVNEERLRFDFTYPFKISEEALQSVENRVNEIINRSLTTVIKTMDKDKALDLGAIALFKEKYQDKVRVVQIGDSIELCGGTHVKNTKDIKNFAIVSCESKGSNVYRIEAVTMDKIQEALFAAIKPYNDEMIKQLMKAKTLIKQAKLEGIILTFDVEIDNAKPVSYCDVIFNRNELEYIQAEVKQLEKDYIIEKRKKALDNIDNYLDKQEQINEVNCLFQVVENMDMEVLKELVDDLLNRLGCGFIFFVNVALDGSIQYMARSNCSTNAGDMMKMATQFSDGKGGGSATFARGSGKTMQNLESIIATIKSEIRK